MAYGTAAAGGYDDGYSGYGAQSGGYDRSGASGMRKPDYGGYGAVRPPTPLPHVLLMFVTCLQHLGCDRQGLCSSEPHYYLLCFGSMLLLCRPTGSALTQCANHAGGRWIWGRRGCWLRPACGLLRLWPGRWRQSETPEPIPAGLIATQLQTQHFNIGIIHTLSPFKVPAATLCNMDAASQFVMTMIRNVALSLMLRSNTALKSSEGDDGMAFLLQGGYGGYGSGGGGYGMQGGEPLGLLNKCNITNKDKNMYVTVEGLSLSWRIVENASSQVGNMANASATSPGSRESRHHTGTSRYDRTGVWVSSTVSLLKQFPCCVPYFQASVLRGQCCNGLRHFAVVT